MEEFLCLVHKLSVTLTALQYEPQFKWSKKVDVQNAEIADHISKKNYQSHQK